MDNNEVEGTIMGVIGLVLLWVAMFLIYFYYFSLVFYIPGMFCAIIAKRLLKHSKVFGVLFICSGFLNFGLYMPSLISCLLFMSNGTYSIYRVFDLLYLLFFFLLVAVSVVTILVGVSLIVPLRRLVTRQNIK